MCRKKERQAIRECAHHNSPRNTAIPSRAEGPTDGRKVGESAIVDINCADCDAGAENKIDAEVVFEFWSLVVGLTSCGYKSCQGEEGKDRKLHCFELRYECSPSIMQSCFAKLKVDAEMGFYSSVSSEASRRGCRNVPLLISYVHCTAEMARSCTCFQPTNAENYAPAEL
jgi:hypothetical protein